MEVERCGQAERLLQQNLAGGGFEQVAAADDFGDAQVGIVDGAGELVAGQAVPAPEEEVAEVGFYAATGAEALWAAVAVDEGDRSRRRGRGSGSWCRVPAAALLWRSGGGSGRCRRVRRRCLRAVRRSPAGGRDAYRCKGKRDPGLGVGRARRDKAGGVRTGGIRTSRRGPASGGRLLRLRRSVLWSAVGRGRRCGAGVGRWRRGLGRVRAGRSRA